MRIAAAIGILWLLTGVTIVRPNEAAVVRRFGAVIQRRAEPGLLLALPWPVDRVDRVPVREQRRLTVGFEAGDVVLGRPADPRQREFLTGDQNLVYLQAVVQYTIRDPVAWLLAARDPEGMLRRAAESTLAAVAAGQPVDALLTTGRLALQERLRVGTQERADRYGLGVDVNTVLLQEVAPPAEVAEAFKAVASAREDRNRIVNEAEAYRNDVVPRARGEAERLIQEAIAYRDRRIATARGDARRFLQAYTAYRLAPGVTATRLYLETIEELLPRWKTIVVDRHGGRAPVDLGILRRTAPGRPAAPGTSPPGNAPAP